MKLWIDDLRPAPAGYVCCKSVNRAIAAIEESEKRIKLLTEFGRMCFSSSF